MVWIQKVRCCRYLSCWTVCNFKSLANFAFLKLCTWSALYSHWQVWSFAHIPGAMHRTCSRWWRKVAAKLFRSIFARRTVNQRVFQPTNKSPGQRSNHKLFRKFYVPSPVQTKVNQNWYAGLVIRSVRSEFSRLNPLELFKEYFHVLRLNIKIF